MISSNNRLIKFGEIPFLLIKLHLLYKSDFYKNIATVTYSIFTLDHGTYSTLDKNLQKHETFFHVTKPIKGNIIIQDTERFFFFQETFVHVGPTIV